MRLLVCLNCTREYKNNQELAEMVRWQGYEWVEHPEDLGYITTTHLKDNVMPTLPHWQPEIYLADELPKMELRGL